MKVRTCGDGACALHAAFGALDGRSECVCPDARVRAADALQAWVHGVPPEQFAGELGRRSPRSNLVVSAFWSMACRACSGRGEGGREQRLWWQACPDDVQRRVDCAMQSHARALAQQAEIMRKFAETARVICVSWSNRELFVQRVALEVHGFDIGSFPHNIHEHSDASSHDLLSPALEYHQDSVIVKGTAANPVPFPAHGPANKYVALFDNNAIFDVLRKSFFITGSREKQTGIIQTLCDCELEVAEDVMADFREMLLQDMGNLNPVPEPFAGFDRMAVSSFGRAVRGSSYWLSLDELLFLADVFDESVLVMELRDGDAHFAGSSRIHAEKPVALVGIDSHRSGVVRSHFSRMVVVPPPSVASEMRLDDAAGVTEQVRHGAGISPARDKLDVAEVAVVGVAESSSAGSSTQIW